MVKKPGKLQENDAQAPDYLQWVGAVNYSTVDDFISEGVSQGVCKRIGRLPNDLVLGESRIFLAHDDGLVGEGFVFGYYVPNRLEVLAGKESDIPKKFADFATWVEDWSGEQIRGCGVRSEGAYLVSGEPGAFVVFDPPISLNALAPDCPHFRGLLEVDFGDWIVRQTEGWGDMDPSDRKKLAFTPPSRIKPKKREISDEELIELMEEGPSMSYVAQRLALETGAKKSSFAYRYKKLTEGDEN